MNMNSSFFQEIHKQRNLGDTFRLYDEHVNLKIALGLKKVSHIVVQRFDYFLESKIKQLVRDEVALKMKNFEMKQ